MTQTIVLHVGPGYGQRGGVASVVEEIRAQAPAFAAAGIDVRHFPIHGFRGRGGLAAFVLADLPCFALAAGRANVIHLHVSARGSLLRKFCCFLLARLWRRATVFHLHGGDVGDYLAGLPRFAQHLVRWWVQSSDAVVAVSPPMADLVRRQIAPRAVVRVVPNTAAAFERAGWVAYLPAYLDARMPRTVLFAGRLTRQKGLADLLQAMALLKARGLPVRLCVAGSGDATPWRQLACALGIEGAVHWAGWVSGPAKLALYRAATVFCVPSHYESFGIAALEAMWVRLPVVGTRTGGFPYVVEDGVSGCLVDVGDVTALADALQRLLDDVPLARRMGEAGHARAAARFSTQAVRELYIACYRELST